MRSCEHDALLQITGGKEVALYKFDRFDQVIQDLPDPGRQYPRLVHFIGRRQKELALKYLFPRNKIARRRQPSIANLRVDTSTLPAERPLLFLDSDPFAGGGNVPQPAECHPIVPFPVSWSPHFDFTINDAIHARLLFPLSDVVCAFVDDFPSIEDFGQQLIQWTRFGLLSNLSSQVRPQLLVITSDSCMPPETADLCFEEFRHSVYQGCRENDLSEVFSSIQIFRLENARTPVARYRRLKEVFVNISLEMSDIRKEHSVLFSAIHLKCFFDRALAHLAKSANTPFDFLSAARRGNEISESLSHHLANFLRIGQESKINLSDLVPSISSALLMDSYPPGMHVFDTTWVFRELYHMPCFAAFEQFCHSTVLAHSYCTEVKLAMLGLARALQQGDTSSSRLRLETLSGKSRQWSLLQSNKTCLFCLCRPPEHVLPCSHSVCDTCVLRFGTGIPGVEHWFSFTTCILCQAPMDFTIKLKPPTAGVRILSIDGGGTRGAVSSESLCLLQNIIGDFPLRELFDLAVGTSSGGLITLGLYAQPWDPDQCSKAFDALSQQLFGREKKSAESFLARLKHYARCVMSDGEYDPLVFESSLKNIFGESRRMFDTPIDRISGSKFAVVATSISDATPFILSNYNGAAPKNQRTAYELLRPEDVIAEPCIWQAARATSAAPLLYQTVRIGDLSFQDGALKHNNPSKLADWESRRLWPSVKGPDVFLSLGTGIPTINKSNLSPHFRHIFVDGFILRILRSVESQTDGEIIWTELLNSVDENRRSDYLRLNVTLPGPAALDDVKVMRHLRERVRSADSMASLDIAKALLVSCFYFVLDHKPIYERGRFRVQGSVRCRSRIYEIVNSLRNMDITLIEFSTDTEVLSSSRPVGDDICEVCHRYRRNIQFYIRHPSDVVCVFMRSGKDFKRKLSGFPQTMDWFTEQQGLRQEFGSSSHGIPGLLQCGACSKSQMSQRNEKRGSWGVDEGRYARKRLRV